VVPVVPAAKARPTAAEAAGVRREKFARLLLAGLFIGAGVNHFVSPEPYVWIMPPFLPWALALVYISGVAEIIGGIGLLFTRTRKIAAYGLIALLLAVFPANIFGALQGTSVSGAIPPWLLWARLPFQAVLILWVYYAGLRSSDPAAGIVHRQKSREHGP